MIIKKISTNKIKKTPRGFAALLSSLLLSIILATLSLSANFSSFMYRTDIDSSNDKKIAESSAESCMTIAISLYRKELLNVGSSSLITLTPTNTCKILDIISAGSKIIFTTQSTHNKSIGQVQVRAEYAGTLHPSFKILTWRENNL